MTSPVFGLRRPEGSSDEIIVDELERQAAEILDPWNKKEYLSLVEVCGGNLRLNRCLAESAKRKAQDEEVSSGDSGTPSFMEELMGTVGGEIVVPEGGLFRSRYDLSDEYGTMLFDSGCRVEVAKALINLHCSSEGTTK